MKQQFGFENLRGRSLKSIRNLDLMLTVAVGYIGFISEKRDERIAVMQLIERSKRIYGVNKFAFYAIAYGLFVVFFKMQASYIQYVEEKTKIYAVILVS